jgi:hypothetical protein
MLEFVETGPTEKNRDGRIESAKNSNNDSNSGSSVKEEDEDVRNTLLIIHFVAGSALTCIDCVNR